MIYRKLLLLPPISNGTYFIDSFYLKYFKDEDYSKFLYPSPHHFLSKRNYQQ